MSADASYAIASGFQLFSSRRRPFTGALCWMQQSPRGYRRLHIAAATDFEDEEGLDILLA
jgi:hypothetical protein